MRSLKLVKNRRAIPPPPEEQTSKKQQNESDAELSRILVYTAFGWSYLEPNSDPMKPPGFLMKVA